MEKTEARRQIRAALAESAEVAGRVSELCVDDIAHAAELIARAIRGEGKLMLCGNGGSAADAQHMATEFLCRLTKDFDRPGLPAIALTSNGAFLTAYTNDVGFEGIFARQVAALGRPGDVLIVISTSGASENVLLAAHEARRRDLRVLALTGDRGPLAELADVAVCVPSGDTQRIQEAHLAIEHLICHLVERQLFPQTAGVATSGQSGDLLKPVPAEP